MNTLGPHVGEFFAGNFKHQKGPMAGQPFVLEPWQQRDIDLIFELDRFGRRKWRSVLYGVPRGNGKSPIAAGIGLLELMTRDDAPEVFAAAASRGQATIVHDFARYFVQSGPLLDYVHVPKSKTAALVARHNDGIMRVLSADGDLQHGLSPSVIIIDELHAFTTNKQEELYFAMATATQKRDQSIMATITTAGKNKASLLGEKYDAVLGTHDLEYTDHGCRVVARDEQTGSLMIWYGAPENSDPADPDIWRGVNPASWVPIAEFARLARELPESVFRCRHLNQWVLGADAAIQPASWDACEDAAASVINPDEEVWACVDVGERRDSSSVGIISPAADGRIRVYSTVFNPAKEHARTLLPMIEAEVRRIASTYQLRGVAFDPWQFRRSGEILASEGIRMIQVPQNDSHMVPASQMFFDLVEQGRLVHNGDKLLRQHVLAAEAKQTSRGTWRLAKPLQSHGRRTDESQKVDAAIALVMGCAAYSQDSQTSGDVWAATW